MNYNDFGHAMARFDSHTYTFPNQPTWIVMDDEHASAYRIVERTRVFGDDWLHSAKNLTALATAIGVDSSGLEAQVAEFNARARDGYDPVFHRGESPWETYRADPQYQNPTVRPLSGNRYFAFRQTLSVLGTNGGPVIDPSARVLELSGKPIGRLFAAGNAAASIFGRAYPGGGATLGLAATFGYVAGRAATD
jgi:hypothetical protein